MTPSRGLPPPPSLDSQRDQAHQGQECGLFSSPAAIVQREHGFPRHVQMSLFQKVYSRAEFALPGSEQGSASSPRVSGKIGPGQNFRRRSWARAVKGYRAGSSVSVCRRRALASFDAVLSLEYLPVSYFEDGHQSDLLLLKNSLQTRVVRLELPVK